MGRSSKISIGEQSIPSKGLELYCGWDEWRRHNMFLGWEGHNTWGGPIIHYTSMDSKSSTDDLYLKGGQG